MQALQTFLLGAYAYSPLSHFMVASSAGDSIKSGADQACSQGACGGGSLAGLFGSISKLLIFLIGAIAILMLIVGGLRYVLSAGNSSAVNDAKNTILYAVVGIVIAMSAYAIVTFVTGHV